MSEQQVQDSLDAIIELLAQSNLEIIGTDGKRQRFSPTMVDTKIMHFEKLRSDQVHSEIADETMRLAIESPPMGEPIDPFDIRDHMRDYFER